MTVERADGEQLLGSGATPLRAALDAAGFVATPRGLRLRPSGRPDVPEGDAVWRTARRLHQGLSGRTLVRTDFRVPGHRDRRPVGRHGRRDRLARQAPADPHRRTTGDSTHGPCTPT